MKHICSWSLQTDGLLFHLGALIITFKVPFFIVLCCNFFNFACNSAQKTFIHITLKKPAVEFFFSLIFLICCGRQQYAFYGSNNWWSEQCSFREIVLNNKQIIIRKINQSQMPVSENNQDSFARFKIFNKPGS